MAAADNSATMYLFKEDLQKLADRLGIEIRVPTTRLTARSGTDEHRLSPT